MVKLKGGLTKCKFGITKVKGSYNIDLEQFKNRITTNTSAILLVHTGGEPVLETKEIVQFTIWKEVNQLQELVNHLEEVKGLIGFNNISFVLDY